MLVNISGSLNMPNSHSFGFIGGLEDPNVPALFFRASLLAEILLTLTSTIYVEPTEM